jgi:hypothetical protein
MVDVSNLVIRVCIKLVVVGISAGVSAEFLIGAAQNTVTTFQTIFVQHS